MQMWWKNREISLLVLWQYITFKVPLYIVRLDFFKSPFPLRRRWNEGLLYFICNSSEVFLLCFIILFSTPRAYNLCRLNVIRYPFNAYCDRLHYLVGILLAFYRINLFDELYFFYVGTPIPCRNKPFLQKSRWTWWLTRPSVVCWFLSKICLIWQACGA